MQEERFWTLASIMLAGEASPEESAELEEMLRQHPEWALRLEIMGNIWRTYYPGTARTQKAFDKHLQRLSAHLSTPALQYDRPEEKVNLRPEADHAAAAAQSSIPISSAPSGLPETDHRTSRSPGRPRRLFWLTIAAAVLGGIIFFTYPFIGHKDSPRNTVANTVSTRPGSRTRIQLPDGTQVWLNADSRIIYNANFSGPLREVQLAGEAYFDVAKDKEHPFVIHTSAIDLRVLGTSFDVRSYSNEKNTETALFQGSVEVILRSSPDRKIVLKPNEKLIVHNDEMVLAPGKSSVQGQRGQSVDREEPLITLGKVHFQKKDSSITETLWIRNQLAFDNVTLEEAALQIERWYGVKVSIRDEMLKRTAYSAVFEDETLDQVMEALRFSGNFHYTVRKKEVTITR